MRAARSRPAASSGSAPENHLHVVLGSKLPLTCLSPEQREFLTKLARLGMAILVGHRGGDEFVRENDWQLADPADNEVRLATFRPGDALYGLTGGKVIVIDVDTKNGADIERTRAIIEGAGVTIYAEDITPSGGRHFYVQGHPDVPNVSASSGHEGLQGLPGVEILSARRNVFLPGTTRPKYGGDGYALVFDNLDALLDGGDPLGAEALKGLVYERLASAGAGTDQPAPLWDGRKQPSHRERWYLDAALNGEVDKVATAHEGERNNTLFVAALRLGSLVAGAGLDEAQVRMDLTAAATACGLSSTEIAKTITSGLDSGRQRPRAVPADAPPNSPTATRTSTAVPATTGGDPTRALSLLRALLDELREWQHLPDPTHVVAVIAAAATRDADGEPCWLLLVAPPSSGKTEAVRILDDIADARLNEISAAGMLGWSKGKDSRPIGVLARIGDHALVTISDLSSLLATSDRGGRDQLFALLRDTYDGHVSRSISPHGRTTTDWLEWTGRLTLIACVTEAIDRYSVHADQLGPRWIYVRLPERSTKEKRRAADLARHSGLASRRAAARALARQVIDAAAPPEQAPEAVADTITNAALVTAWGRAAVPRNGYGRREIDGMPIVEEPMRLVHQLDMVARGLLGLGLSGEATATIVRRVALDSIPENRRAVLTALAAGEPLNTSQVARVAGRLNRAVARRTLEELAVIGVATNDRVDDDRDEITGTVTWSLSGDDGTLIAEVINAHERAGGWHEMWVHTSLSPKRGTQEIATAQTEPTLRATRDGGFDLLSVRAEDEEAS